MGSSLFDPNAFVNRFAFSLILHREVGVAEIASTRVGSRPRSRSSSALRGMAMSRDLSWGKAGRRPEEKSQKPVLYPQISPPPFYLNGATPRRPAERHANGLPIC